MEIIQGEFEFDGFNLIPLPGAGSVANIEGDGCGPGRRIGVIPFWFFEISKVFLCDLI